MKQMTQLTETNRLLTPLLVLLAALPFAEGCGKSQASREDLSRLSETLNSASRIKSTVPTRGTDPQKNPLSLRVAEIHAPAMTWAASLTGASSTKKPASPRKDEQADRMQNRLEQESGSGHCNIRSPQLEAKLGDIPQFELPQFDIHVDGSGCPIRLDLSLTSKTGRDGSSLGANFIAKYEVLNRDYLEFNDVDALDVTGTFEVAQSASQTAESTARVQGSLHSQKHGTLQITIEGKSSGKGSETDSDVTAKFAFSDKTITLRSKQESGQNKFFIDDKEVTQEEFEAVFGNNAEFGSGSSSTENDSYSYELSFNGCSTGRQTFSSFADECNGLQSTSLNGGCAEPLRREFFKGNKCPGSFTVKP